MEPVIAILSGVLVAAAVWLMLAGNLLRFLFGLLLLSNGINLAILTAGRLTLETPPLLGEGGALPTHGMANSLPQALLLTAIVIGFGLFAFALALAVRSYRAFGHLEMDRMRLAEPVEAPPVPGPGAEVPEGLALPPDTPAKAAQGSGGIATAVGSEAAAGLGDAGARDNAAKGTDPGQRPGAAEGQA